MEKNTKGKVVRKRGNGFVCATNMEIPLDEDDTT